MNRFRINFQGLAWCLGAVLVLAGVSVAQTPAAPFSLTITMAGATVKAGADIPIWIRMTNVSDHDVDCSGVPSDGVDKSYHYAVTDAAGNAIPPLATPPNSRPAPYRIAQCRIKPGESAEISITYINHVVRLRPGNYVVEVSRNVLGNDPDAGVVESNKLTLTVVQ